MQRKRVGYPRMLVTAGIQEEPKPVVHYVLEGGRMMEQKVKYEWLPVRCSGCHGFGHKNEVCRKQVQRRVWVPKKKWNEVKRAELELPELSKQSEQSEWVTVRHKKVVRAGIQITKQSGST